MGSGEASPLRSVTRMKAASVAASWWTSAADPSSRRCASSTRTASRRPSACWTSDCRPWRRISSRSAAPPRGGGSSGASAPNGMLAAALVATASRVLQPRSRAAASASQASLLFPTPVAPASTTLRNASPSIVSATRSSSSCRPTRGHAVTMGPWILRTTRFVAPSGTWQTARAPTHRERRAPPAPPRQGAYVASLSSGATSSE
jgi:hypothetical protein